MLIALCIYLWLLLAVAVCWFSDVLGSPYSRKQLFIRGLMLPVVFPFLILMHLLDN